MVKTYQILWFRIVIIGITVIGLFLPAQEASAKADVLYNGDFESGTLRIHGNEIDGWTQDGWKIGRSIFDWDYLFTHSGRHSAKITNKYKNEARWVQTVQVQPRSIYRLSGWIRTQSIPYGTTEGASLAIVGTDIQTKPMLGTHNWTYVYVDFITKDETYVQVAASLGNRNGRVIGTAWFDDIRFELINTPKCFSLNIKMNPPLMGSKVEINPPPNCNNGTQYAYGTQVMLKAVPLPASGYEFVNWQNASAHLKNPLMVTMTTDQTLTAYFGKSIRQKPTWKILALVYKKVDFRYFDLAGTHHFVSELTTSEVDRAVTAVSRFVEWDIPELSSGNVRPTLTIRFPDRALTTLQKFCGYYPGVADTQADLDPGFDSVIVIWDDTGIDDIGTELNIADCGGLTLQNGVMQTYSTIPFDSISAYQENVFKHEWGHAILAYFDAAGVSPLPVVNNHINNSTNQYVNCYTGQSYILDVEVFADTIPNSIYNNLSGFTHDYYSGFTASASHPNKCLGISARVWAYGGPTLHNQNPQPQVTSTVIE